MIRGFKSTSSCPGPAKALSRESQESRNDNSMTQSAKASTGSFTPWRHRAKGKAGARTFVLRLFETERLSERITKADLHGARSGRCLNCRKIREVLCRL